MIESIDTDTLTIITTTTVPDALAKQSASGSQLDEIVLRKKSKKRDRSPAPASSHQNETATTTTAKKEKQRPETWNKIEQQIFFNALRQNGKNFESITQHFNASQKRYKTEDGVCIQRSKEQIRHFYYRTWHKIVKHISIPSLEKENAAAVVSDEAAAATTVVAAATVQASSKTAANSSQNYCINMGDMTLRDVQVKCLIAFNTLMTNKSTRNENKKIYKFHISSNSPFN